MIDSASRYTVYLGSAIAEQLNATASGKLQMYFPRGAVFGKESKRRVIHNDAHRIWSSFRFPFQICHRANDDKIDLVHIQLEINTFGHPITLSMLSLLLIGLRAANKKIVITLHGVFPRFLLSSTGPDIIGKSLKKAAFLAFFTLFYKSLSFFSARIIVHSQVFKDWLCDYKISAQKIVSIPHGTTARYCKTDKLRIQDWIQRTHSKRVLLCFGVLSPRKGLEILIEAFKNAYASHSDILLVLAGSEPLYFSGYKEKLLSLAIKHKIESNILFTGRIAEKDISPLFGIAEMVILPYTYSVSASGPLSISLQYSKPIVAADTVFFRSELTNYENVVFAKSGDVPSLSSAITEVLDNVILREKISAGAHLVALKSSWLNIAQITIKLYQDVIVEK